MCWCKMKGCILQYLAANIFLCVCIETVKAVPSCGCVWLQASLIFMQPQHPLCHGQVIKEPPAG